MEDKRHPDASTRIRRAAEDGLRNGKCPASLGLRQVPHVLGTPDDVISDALFMYKRDGRLGMDVGDTGYGLPAIGRSSMGILFYEKHWASYEGTFWDDYGTTRPVYVRDREGVPLVTAYQRGRP